VKKNKLPSNHLDIVVPVLSRSLYLGEYVTSSIEVDQEIELYLLTKKSRLIVREAVEVIAHYFRREFEYDFAGYHAREQTRLRDWIFLLVDEHWGESYAVGAVVFRWREYTDAPAQLVLSWVWIHPFLRRKGILTAYWERFRKLYGNFPVEGPLSKAMEAFLEKMGHGLMQSEERSIR